MNGFETETPKKHYKTDRTLRVRIIAKSLETIEKQGFPGFYFA